MDKFPDRIKILREYLGLTQAEFAFRIGKEENTVNSWEAGRNTPHLSTVRQIAEKTGCNFHWLRTGQDSMFANESKILQLREQTTAIINKSNQHPGIRVWANAGLGDPWEPEGSEPIEIIDAAHLVSPRYKDAFRAIGPSMLPVIRDGALCFCDFDDKRIRAGEIYALSTPAEGLVIKELRVFKEAIGQPETIIVYSYDEQKFPPKPYSLDEISEGNIIIGRIVLIHMLTKQ